MQIPIIHIGDYVSALLLSHSEGNVLASFSEATYLRHGSDELIWIVGQDAPMHRRAIQIAGQLPKISINTTFVIQDKCLDLGSDLQLDFSQAQQWTLQSFSSSEVLSLHDLQNNFFKFSSFHKFLPIPAGFGIFIPQIIGLLHLHSDVPVAKSSIWAASQNFAWPLVTEISKACVTHRLDGILLQAKELIGLGEGLTPSGDDFLGGLFFCMRTLQDLFSVFHPSYFERLVKILPDWEPRTNLISFTMLKDHVHGHTFETLHEFVRAFLTKKGMEDIGQSASDLVQIGHSTGWDMLAGILTGMLLIYDSDPLVVIRSKTTNSHCS